MLAKRTNRIVFFLGVEWISIADNCVMTDLGYCCDINIGDINITYSPEGPSSSCMM